MDDEAEEALPARDLTDFRTLGPGGERRNAVDPGLDLPQGTAHVGALFELGDHRAHAFGGGRFHPLQAFRRPDLLFELADNGFLHLLGSGAGVGHHHLDAIQRRLGKDFLHEVARRCQSRKKEKAHQQIRRDAIFRHEGDGAAMVHGLRQYSLPVMA